VSLSKSRWKTKQCKAPSEFFFFAIKKEKIFFAKAIVFCIEITYRYYGVVAIIE
jgi:hypothetical protein